MNVRRKKLIQSFIFVINIIFILGIFKFVSFRSAGNKDVLVDGKTMKAYIEGVGEKTIVMLSGWGTESPIDDFKLLAGKLSENYRVIILEYFGYGGSEITTSERSNKVIVDEIRKALQKLGIKAPYILMPHSMSGLYSLYYACNFPDEVSGIIGIDASLPKKQLERWKEDTFQKLNESSGLNFSIIDQWNKFYDNSKELEGFKYPSNLPVLSFLATEQIESVDKMIANKEMTSSWINLNKEMITNDNIQFINVLEGEHYLHHNRAYEISEFSKAFIEKYVK